MNKEGQKIGIDFTRFEPKVLDPKDPKIVNRITETLGEIDRIEKQKQINGRFPHH